LLLAFSEWNLWIFGLVCRVFRPLAVSQSRLDDEGIAAVNRRRPGHCSIKISFDLLVQAVEDRLFTDGRDTVARRRHDLSGLDRFIERLRRGAVNVSGSRVRRNFRGLADLVGEVGGNPAEVTGQKSGQRMALGIV
jgi:hypothetical protein